MEKLRALQCDNFFENPNLIRECALAQQYRGPRDDENWIGLRTERFEAEIGGVDIDDYINEKIQTWLPAIPELELICVFHQLPERVRGDMGDRFDYLQSHTDSDTVHFAGVIYLSPNPPENSGTSFFADVNTKMAEIENVYNRFIFYPSDILHGPTNPFGETNEDSRLTLTFFAFIKDKSKIGNSKNT